MFVVPCIVIYFCSKSNKMDQCLKFILFLRNTLHVSDGLSVHHQEIKTVHTATCICLTYVVTCTYIRVVVNHVAYSPIVIGIMYWTVP